MLYYLGLWLQDYYGPFRLFTSHLFLGALGVTTCFSLTFFFLPRLWGKLSSDRGREHAVNSQLAKGKPTGAGLIFISIFIAVELLCLPLSFKIVSVLIITALAMLSGWFDDVATTPWGEYKKAIIDFILALATTLIICQFESMQIWLPFTKTTVDLHWLPYSLLGSVLIWIAINCTNCTDCVDGLSGTLTAIAFTVLGGLLYFVLGHHEVAKYLLLPHYAEASSWAMLAFALVGTILGYLWYNAYPSHVLMGDAGSRALGYLLGVLVLVTGNPFLILIVAGVLVINGGTGLVKVALLRFTKIAIFSNIRFPLHDHVRQKRNWSNTQVLVRFAILQVIISLVLIIAIVKIR